MGETLVVPPTREGSPEPTAECQSKCLVRVQRVSISSLMSRFESCPLTSTDLVREC